MPLRRHKVFANTENAMNNGYPPALYRVAAIAALVTAVIFLLYFGLSGFNSSATPAMLGGLIWVWLSASLHAGRRKRAYVAFIVALVGQIALWANFVVPDSSSVWNLQWLLAALIILNLIIACLLFVILWRHPHTISRQAYR